MTVSVSTASNPVVKNVVVDLDANLVVETAATATQYVYAVEITNGSAEAVYLHMIKATQGSNTGTAHTTQLYCAGNTSCYYYNFTLLKQLVAEQMQKRQREPFQ